MKVNELMVGDYIYVKRGYDNHLTLESIKGILQDEKETYPIKITTGETIRLEDIIPIPLTPGILEKNFPIANGCEYRDDNNGVCIEVYFNAKTEKYKKYAILYTDRGKIYIDKYVHQLQNALRLCEIEKEIKLWSKADKNMYISWGDMSEEEKAEFFKSDPFKIKKDE